MARIDIPTIKHIDKERNSVHSKVQATYTTFEENGKLYVQIDTYGRPGREMPDKISQSLQLDHESAVFLVELLTETFDLT